MTLPRSGFLSSGGGAGGGSGDVTAAANIPDNEIVRGDGGVKGVQGSGITIADGATGSLAGTNSGDVTLAGTPDYITIAGQVITRAKLDPADDLNTFASSVLATLLTDETGTDKVVFNTDPVFASTITVPNVGLHLLDTDASHDLIVKPGSDLTVDRTLTVTTGDADRTLTLSGDATISGTNTGDGIGGSTGATDNAILRADGTGGATAQSSGFTITDTPSLNLASIGLKYAGSGNWLYVNRGTSNESDFGNVGAGFFAAGPNTSSFVTGAGFYAVLDGGRGLNLLNTAQVAWSSGTNPFTGWDTGLVRNAAGVLRVTDGSIGIKSILNTVLIEANTAGSGSPNLLAATESGTLISNEGSTATNYNTLPAAASGLRFEGVVQDADGQRWTCQAGDTIQYGGAVSATGGYLESSTVGDSFECTAINATQFIITKLNGTGWTIV